MIIEHRPLKMLVRAVVKEAVAVYDHKEKHNFSCVDVLWFCSWSLKLEANRLPLVSSVARKYLYACASSVPSNTWLKKIHEKNYLPAKSLPVASFQQVEKKISSTTLTICDCKSPNSHSSE